jgi:hypothetical protein
MELEGSATVELYSAGLAAGDAGAALSHLDLSSNHIRSEGTGCRHPARTTTGQEGLRQRQTNTSTKHHADREMGLPVRLVW